MTRVLLALLALTALTTFACATPPRGQVWVHETRSPAQMEDHLSGCKVNTFFLWPFDWASKCMRRRGYELHEADRSDPNPAVSSAHSPDRSDP